MTETTKEIFDKYEIRKTKAQREAFVSYVSDVAKNEGYKCNIEAIGKNKKLKNIVIGDPDSAKVIYTAHYDTCASIGMPNVITPKCPPLYFLYQLLICAILYTVPFLIMLVGSKHVLQLTGSTALSYATMLFGYAIIILEVALMLYGPANKHTANDNTSGVTLLLDIMKDMPNEMRDNVAFIFFDLEESGTLGSKLYAKKHPKLQEEAFIVNFDCVSDGKTMLFVAKKEAAKYADKLTEAFQSNGTYEVDVTTKWAIYPSDQRNFKHGVGVSSMNKTKHGLLYMNKIHTQRDTVYDEDNIEFLKNGAIRLTEIMQTK